MQQIVLWVVFQDKCVFPFARMDKLQVVVVGAGAAGVAAAARLMEHGVRDVVILEAGDRMGGRIHTALFGKPFLLFYLYFTTSVTDQQYKINYISVEVFRSGTLLLWQLRKVVPNLEVL
jgi:hypothetical protein